MKDYRNKLTKWDKTKQPEFNKLIIETKKIVKTKKYTEKFLNK